MSYLKQTLNLVVMGLIVTSLTACGDGAFKAEEFSIKDTNPHPFADNARPALSEEQIKALYAENERRSSELSEEIALKNEVVSNLQISLADSQAQLEALNEKVLEVIAADISSSDKVEELNALRSEIAALKEQMSSDREQYTEALGSVNSNDVALRDYLVEVREEINRLKEKQGQITDQEILDIEKRLSDRIEQVIVKNEGDRSGLISEIEVLRAEITKLEKDIQIIESVPAADLPDRQNILNELTKLKEQLVIAQSEMTAKSEELNAIDNTIVELLCVDQQQSCEYVQTDSKPNLTAQENPATPVQTSEESDARQENDQETAQIADTSEPAANEENEIKVVINGVEVDVEAASPVVSQEDAALNEKLRKNEADLLNAEENRRILRSEVDDIKALADTLKLEVEAVENQQFDEISLREAATTDAERIASEERSRALLEQKNQILNSIRQANVRIANIQNGDIAQIDARIVEIKKEKAELLSGRTNLPANVVIHRSGR